LALISHADEDSFVITDIKTGAATEAPYTDVTQEKGQNLLTGATVAIAAAVAAGVTLLVIYLAPGAYE